MRAGPLPRPTDGAGDGPLLAGRPGEGPLLVLTPPTILAPLWEGGRRAPMPPPPTPLLAWVFAKVGRVPPGAVRGSAAVPRSLPLEPGRPRSAVGVGRAPPPRLATPLRDGGGAVVAVATSPGRGCWWIGGCMRAGMPFRGGEGLRCWAAALLPPGAVCAWRLGPPPLSKAANPDKSMVAACMRCLGGFSTALRLSAGSHSIQASGLLPKSTAPGPRTTRREGEAPRRRLLVLPLGPLPPFPSRWL